VTAPALVLVLFYVALRRLVSLPQRLAQGAVDGRRHAAAAGSLMAERTGTRWHRLRSFLSHVWRLLRLVLESKDALVDSVALVRLANPVSLGILFAAVVGGLATASFATVVTVIQLLP
jgi:hypothetical protein